MYGLNVIEGMTGHLLNINEMDSFCQQLIMIFLTFSEMLNHATMKVMEAEKQKTDSEAEHLQRAAFYTAAEQACQRLEKRLKKNVVKSHHYFEQKDAFNKTLEAQKFQVQSLQSKVCM